MKFTTRWFGALIAAMALVSAFGCVSTSTQEGTGEYIDDTILTTRVKHAIHHDPSLKGHEINVETFKGTVQLSGFVRSQANVNTAVEVASGVKGVKSVMNDMRVK